MSFHGYGGPDPYDYEPPPESGAELTNFDRTALRIIFLGIFVLLVLHLGLVGDARVLYSPLDRALPGLTKLVFSKGYPVAGSMLLGYIAYHGHRTRRLYDAPSTSRVFFLGIVLAIVVNGLLVYGLYTPAGGAVDSLRGTRSSDTY